MKNKDLSKARVHCRTRPLY